MTKTLHTVTEKDHAECTFTVKMLATVLIEAAVLLIQNIFGCSIDFIKEIFIFSCMPTQKGQLRQHFIDVCVTY